MITLAPQSPDEHYRMEDTVYKNLEDAAKLYGPSELAENPELRKEEVLSVLKKLDLESVKGSKCSSLSGGQKKKLTIAMEYITRPEILFMDEPDSGVDGSNGHGGHDHTERDYGLKGKNLMCYHSYTRSYSSSSLTRSWWLERVRKDAEDFVTLDLLTMR